MNRQVRFLCDCYVEWLKRECVGRGRPTAYLFSPEHGGDQEANQRILEGIQGLDIPVVWCDRREWAG